MDFHFGTKRGSAADGGGRSAKWRKRVGAALALLPLLFYFSPSMRALRALPDALYLSGNESPGAGGLPSSAVGALLPENRAVTASLAGGERLALAAGQTSIRYQLFGVLPLKSIALYTDADAQLTPGGRAVGITIRTEGVLVVGLGSVQTAEGPASPGAAAGIEAGDVLLSVNGRALDSSETLARLCATETDALLFEIDRGGETRSVRVQPARNAEGAMQLGLWVRDSTAGVGTLSFYDPETGWFAALGHPVSDVDTRTVLRVREGKLIASRIADVHPGAAGEPGELVGVFPIYGEAVGSIVENGEYGVFGDMPGGYENTLTGSVPLARPSEAHTGEATLLTTVSDAGITAYTCEIVRVSAQTSTAPKGMVVEITDERLLACTGGIVQGMSGSPVLQDGKLVGVVTHVFVNDPTRGYCVYAAWMLSAVQNAANK